MKKNKYYCNLLSQVKGSLYNRNKQQRRDGNSHCSTHNCEPEVSARHSKDNIQKAKTQQEYFKRANLHQVLNCTVLDFV